MHPQQLARALGQIISDNGYTVKVGHIDADGSNYCRDALRGTTNHLRRTVHIGADLTEWDTIQVLAHELAHVLLHSPFTKRDVMGVPSYMLPQDIAELEAEGTSVVVLKSYGLEDEDWSANYLAGHLRHLGCEGGENVMLQAIEHAKVVAHDTAKTITDDIAALAMPVAA
jgi:hypothetical protein